MESSTPTDPTPPTEPLPPTAPVVPTPPSPDPAEREVRSDQFRTLRRWLIVVGVWAVAATAIGVLAFIEARNAKDASDSRATQADIDQVRDRLRDDIDDLDAQVDSRATRAEVSALEPRIKKAQRDATTARDEATKATDDTGELKPRVNELQTQVDTLETRVDASGDN